MGCFTSSQQKDGICLDLCMSGQHSSSLTISSCRAGTLFCSVFLSSGSGGLDMWRLTELLVKG